MKMKGQLNVKTPAEYIAAVDDKRRSDIAALDALIRKHAPKLEPVIMGGMLGYGPFHYRYASGREGDACKLSIASNASYISLYCFASDATGYVAERYVERLPNCYYALVYDAGHEIEAERPEALFAAVRDFLEQRETFVVSRKNTVINP